MLTEAVMAPISQVQLRLTLKDIVQKRFIQFISLIVVVSITIISCNQVEITKSSLVESSSMQKPLNIWWDKGFNPEEDEALRSLVRHWEDKTKNQINLVFYTTDSLGEKIRRSLKAGNPPDIVMSFKAERSPNSRLAWDNKLLDVSDIINPIKNLYPQDILQTVNFYNNVDKKRHYYAIPIHQGTMHIYYWRDLLAEVGRNKQDIPKEWDAFWEFWKQVQDDLREKNNSNNTPKIYSLGFTLSPEAGDTYYLFEQILEAYDIEIVNAEGKLLIDDAKVHQGIVKVLKWYQNFYEQGYIPPAALKWLNPDNNRSILNREIVMTPNATLSIPVAVRQDADIYQKKLGILEFPNKPNGKPMRHLTMAEQAVILAESKNQKLAKDFLKYVVQTDVMKDYLIKAGGRNSPVSDPVWQDAFWTNPNDSHISDATKTFTGGRIRYFYISQNPAYSQVLDRNVWGKAINRVVVDQITPEQAADEAIKEIKLIYQEWENS
ncbi:MAG: carbohydrate ABC transporter substrate-binding protein [Richelia sp. RM2_1_2]|nr:carbohydrate ABC transporter substrate-binding protein [Richelia sp. SM1_7_0]NJN07140.1 carbohydrate ABC transporter substrate-binding protein [Richelia sp. RM1_1_1]NJO26158.1 carbohydrate ABC transporter substrate-binding protein [Richelia sp. SL_2_1]NJO57831.1 carbohydrate ABC transporter substrate-binding protein [Richelia sp. RM2_1_2]NJS15935.1 carbohydrate ABC transporter substrate-binding protein [Nostocaceae cyanobacterium CSU_2_110]